MSVSIVQNQSAGTYCVVCDTESTYTLPQWGSRDSVLVKNVSATELTVDGNGSNTIDGANTVTLRGYSSIELIRGTTSGDWVAVRSYDKTDEEANITIISAYGEGTAYSLTDTAAAVDFGTTDPAVTLTKAGTYLISGQINLAYTGATVVAETATVKLRRTNNTAADVSQVVVIDLPVATTLTNTYGIVTIPPFAYTTTNTDDAIALFAKVSAALGAGTIAATAVGTSIIAVLQ